MGAEPEMMHVEAVDREGLRRRVKDPFYQNTTSILAMENDQVLFTGGLDGVSGFLRKELKE